MRHNAPQEEIRTCEWDAEMKGEPAFKYIPGHRLSLHNEALHPEGSVVYMLTPEEREAVHQQKLSYLGHSIGELKRQLEKSKEEERVTILRAQAFLNQWRKEAARTNAIEEAIEFLEGSFLTYTPTFQNTWQEAVIDEYDGYTYPFNFQSVRYLRSNAIYQAEISAKKVHAYFTRHRQGPWKNREGYGIKVRYRIDLVPPPGSNSTQDCIEVAAVEKDFYDDPVETATKYLEGRMAAIEKKYFSVDNPYVPKEHWREFCVGDFFIPYYRKDPAQVMETKNISITT